MHNYENPGTIIGYDKKVYIGDLDYSHGRVKGMTEYVMDLFLNAPPKHFIGTLLYFYHYQPELENPITVCAYGDSITTHPGQGRLLSCYFRKHKTIKSLLVPLGNQSEQDETDRQILEETLLREVAPNLVPNTEHEIFEYDNANHHGISTGDFADYFHPTDIRLQYEDDKNKLLKKLILSKGRIVWSFTDRDRITVGKKQVGTPAIVIECTCAEGFYHSLFYLAYGHFKKSKLFSINA